MNFKRRIKTSPFSTFRAPGTSFSILISLIILFVGCVERQRIKPDYPTQRSTEGRFTKTPDYKEAERTPVRLVKRMPWELWPLNRTMQGYPVKNALIIKGDEHLKENEAQAALREYQQALKTQLTQDEYEALIVRIASTQLRLDLSEQALSTLSRYFQRIGKSVDEVDVRFGIIFAYAYGRKGNYDQSFAWFSRINSISAGRGGMADAATEGASLLIRSIKPQEFSNVANTWAADPFISEIFAKDRLRRERRDFDFGANDQTERFWEGEFSVVDLQPDGVDSTAKNKIGVLLPLSGRFGRLGQSTKNGIELALLGQDQPQQVDAIYRDTGGDVMQSRIQLRELVALGEASAYLGPLLSEPAVTASEIARSSRVPMIVFSKRGSFQVGDGVFRLGPTISSQVQSLVLTCRDRLQLNRLALVMPNTDLGQEFGRYFKMLINSNGLELVYEATYMDKDDKALVAIASELESLEVDAVFFPDSMQVAARFYGNLSERARQRIRLLGSAAWDNPAEIANSITVLDGAVFVSPFFAASDSAVVQKFRTAYRNRYSEDPDFLAAQGFDAATLVIAALKRQASVGGDFSQALRSIQAYEGLTGSIWVDPQGEIGRRFVVAEIRRGKMLEIKEPAQPEYVFKGDSSTVSRHSSKGKFFNPDTSVPAIGLNRAKTGNNYGR